VTDQLKEACGLTRIVDLPSDRYEFRVVARGDPGRDIDDRNVARISRNRVGNVPVRRLGTQFEFLGFRVKLAASHHHMMPLAGMQRYLCSPWLILQTPERQTRGASAPG